MTPVHKMTLKELYNYLADPINFGAVNFAPGCERLAKLTGRAG